MLNNAMVVACVRTFTKNQPSLENTLDYYFLWFDTFFNSIFFCLAVKFAIFLMNRKKFTQYRSTCQKCMKALNETVRLTFLNIFLKIIIELLLTIIEVNFSQDFISNLIHWVISYLLNFKSSLMQKHSV